MSASSLVRTAIARTLDTKGAGYFARPGKVSPEFGLNGNDDAAAAFLSSHEWEDVTEEDLIIGTRLGKCRYFRAEIAEGAEGEMGIALTEWSSVNFNIVTRRMFRPRRGHHGNLEIQLAGQAKVMHLIIGSCESFPDGEVTDSTAGVVAWYLGRMTAPVNLEGATVKFIR